MVMNRDLMLTVDSNPTRMLYVLVTRVLATSNRMQQSSKTSSKETSRTFSRVTSHRINRGQWRFRSFPVRLDANIQSLGAPWPAARISKQWYPKWERILLTSYAPPNVASRKVVNNMIQQIVGHHYALVANHLHTTNWFVQLKGYRWRT